MIELFFGLVSFISFLFIQAAFCNGVYELFKGYIDDKGKVHGNLFYLMMPKFIERNKEKVFSKPIFSCLKCMSSFWGAVTLFPVVIYCFGWHNEFIFLWILDACALSWLNFYLYSKT
jgi:hypothetical protein